MIRVVPPLTIRISPNQSRMPRTHPRIRPNSIVMYPEYGPNEICRGHIRNQFLGYSAGFEHFKPNPSTKFSESLTIFFAHSGRENRMLPNPSEFENSGVFAADSVPV